LTLQGGYFVSALFLFLGRPLRYGPFCFYDFRITCPKVFSLLEM